MGSESGGSFAGTVSGGGMLLLALGLSRKVLLGMYGTAVFCLRA